MSLVQEEPTSKLDPASKSEHVPQGHVQLDSGYLRGWSLFAGVPLPLLLPLPFRIMRFMGFFNWSKFPWNKWHKALKTLCASACNKIRLFFFPLWFCFPSSFPL